jgi:hypothetical protein
MKPHAMKRYGDVYAFISSELHGIWQLLASVPVLITMLQDSIRIVERASDFLLIWKRE